MRFQRKQCQVGSKYTKRYSEEYKRDAIELVRSSGRTVTEVARELGVSSESLRGLGEEGPRRPGHRIGTWFRAERGGPPTIGTRS